MTITAALYSHDSVGLGHARRNRALAYALAADLPRITGERVRGLLIAGHPDATQDTLPQGWDWLVLPGFAPDPGGYTSRHLGISNQRLSTLRSSTAAAALEAMDPDLFIVDRHPFGVEGELTEALGTLRQRGTTTVLGLREVIDSPTVACTEWEATGGAAAITALFDSIWIYGDRDVYDPLATGEIPAGLTAHAVFTGYLSHGRPDDPVGTAAVRVPEPYVITMVGGGSDGVELALAAAAAEVPARHRHLILTGPQMPAADHDAVLDAAARSATRGRIRVTRHAPHAPALVRDAAAVITMGGYNSVAEIMATTTPALVVPRAMRRQEQPRRAAALNAVGAVDTLAADQVSPASLRDWLAGAVTGRTWRDGIDLDGLTRIGDIAAELLAERDAPRAGQPGHTVPHTERLSRHAAIR